MSIIGVTVGTPTSPKKIENEIKPVKTINSIAPDDNGNVKLKELPEITETDNGKVLMVVGGTWQAATLAPVDSPLPIEVSTEAEMTALLISGEVGGVYKYTGTTGTYENGALYMLEGDTATKLAKPSIYVEVDATPKLTTPRIYVEVDKILKLAKPSIYVV